MTAKKPPSRRWRVYGPRGVIAGLGEDFRSEKMAMERVTRWNSCGYAATLQRWDGHWRTVQVFQPAPVEAAE